MKEDLPKIGIVNCTYHDYDKIVEFVNSVKSENYLTQFYIQDNTIENIGYARGMNRGIQKAYEDGCNYFFVGNADTQLYPNFLDTIIPLLDKNPDYLFLSGTREDEIEFNIEHPTIAKAGVDGFIVNMPHIAKKVVKYDPDFAAFVFSRLSLEIIQREDKFHEGQYHHEGFLFEDRIWPLYFEDDDLKIRTFMAGYKFGKVNWANFKHVISNTLKTGHADDATANWGRNYQLFVEKFGVKPEEAVWRSFKEDHRNFII